MKKNAPDSVVTSNATRSVRQEIAARGEFAESKPRNSAVTSNPPLAKLTKQNLPTEKLMLEDRTAADYNSVSEHALRDLENEDFNLGDKALTTTWSSASPTICCLNAYPNGVTLSIHDNSANLITPDHSSEVAPASPANQYFSSQFHLRFRDTRDYQVPQGKYFLHKENFKTALEKHLLQLQKKGLLSNSTFYFGTVTDPFMSFGKKFPVTMACFEMLEQYQPGRLVVQTRSPMVIAALPTLKFLAENAVVVMPIETKSESVVVRYMPGQPKISERLVAAQGLRQQGITVNLAASPLLPYGHISRSAWEFAAMLARNADYVTFGSLASGVPSEEAQLRNLEVARKLVADGQELWLRPHCYRYLYSAVKLLAPEKVQLPVSNAKASSQLDLFAA